MSKQQNRLKQYEKLIQQVTETVNISPELLSRWKETSEKYLDAASDMTKDQWALISEYVKRDLEEFASEYEESQEDFENSPFYISIQDSIWRGLAEITDRTQLEWHELLNDMRHDGVYKSGEMVGLGRLVCNQCGNEEYYTHPQEIEPCRKCGYTFFSRKQLRP